MLNFEPHPLLRGGHVQTLAGLYLPGRNDRYRAVQHQVPLADGDAIVLHDDVPPGWEPGVRTALVMHGLAGCHLSPYVVRLAGKLNDVGVRVFRMDLRGCGAGAELARLPYHAGRSDDVHSVVEAIRGLCPGSPLSLIGFSLSGNVLLKLLGEWGESFPVEIESAVAVNPPIDLALCVRGLTRPLNRPYDRHFVKLLYAQVCVRARKQPDVPMPTFRRRPRSLWEFDDVYTAPVSGYSGADEYYARCSSAAFVPGICVPTLIVTSRDDPLVPVEPFEALRLPCSVRLHVVSSGGHLGYVSRNGPDPDRRWMDWRIIEWVTRQPQREPDANTA